MTLTAGPRPNSPGESTPLSLAETLTESSRGDTFHGCFEAIAAARPEALAANGFGGSLTYRELDRSANGVSWLLVDRGVRRGDLVGLRCARGPALLIGLLGILKAGAAYVPIEATDPVARVAAIVADAGISLVVSDRTVPDWTEALVGSAVVITDWQGERRDDPPRPETGQASDLVYVMFTSGSTGTPKGVMVEHSSLMAFLAALQPLAVVDGQVPPQPTVTSATFDPSARQMLAPLLRGDAVWLVSDAVAVDPAALAEELASRPLAALMCVPRLWAAVLDIVEQDPARFTGLRAVLLGGDRVEPAVLERTFAALPDARVAISYGPTEATVFVTFGWQSPGETPTIGEAVPGCRLHVRDSDGGPLLAGEPGELYIAGPQLVRGYLNRPEETDARFVALPDVDEARAYRTGDRVRVLPGGAFEFLGRADRQVKIRGHRVEPDEIEVVLSGLDGVRSCAVEPLSLAEGGHRLEALVVPSREIVDADYLLTALRERLPRFMVPSTLRLAASLPVTSRGKLDRSAVRSMFGVPEAVDDPGRNAAAGDPETLSATEDVLVELWAMLFPGEGPFGRASDFFEVGGDSLTAAKFVGQVRERLHVEVPVTAAFELCTIGELAHAIDYPDEADGFVVVGPEAR